MKLVSKILLQICLFVFPWGIRRRVLSYFFNFKIDQTAKIGFSIFLCDELILEPYSTILHFVFVKNINKLHLRTHAKLGGFNFLSGFNTRNTNVFKHVTERKCEFILGVHTRVTSKHFFDCNGGIYIGDYTTIAGAGSEILTHSIDIYKNMQDVSPVSIGKYCFVGTKSILLKGAILPDYSVLAGGSVLVHNYLQPYTVYGGNPAKPIKDLTGVEVGYFNRTQGNVD